MSNEIAKTGGMTAGIGVMDETDVVSMGNFAQLAQKMSKVCEENKKVKPGDIVDGEGNKLNGKQFIALFKFNVFTKFKPKEEGLGVDWRSTNPKEQRVIDGLVWRRNEKTGKNMKPEVSKSINIIAAFDNDFGKSIIIPFRSTSMKAGQALIKQAISDECIYGRYYSLESEKRTTADNTTYYVMALEIGEKVKPAIMKEAQAQHEIFLAEYTRMAAMLDGASIPGENDAETEAPPAKNGKKKPF